MTSRRGFTWGPWASAGLLLGCFLRPGPSPEAERQIAIARAAADVRKPQGIPSVDLFNRTILAVQEAYFDQSRIEPRTIARAVVRASASVAPQLRVEELDPSTLRISSGPDGRTFDLRPFDTLWRVSVLFKELHGYLTGSLGVDDRSRVLGFAAANGLLATLDPGCVLMSPEEYSVRRAGGVDERKRLFFWTRLGSNVGYIRAQGLLPRASVLMQRAVTEMSSSEEGSALRGIVLDLRGNGGGFFRELLEVANIFFEPGVSVMISVRGETVRAPVPHKDRAVFKGRLAILVDEATSSEAEIVAALLKDLDRAVVLGRRTAGAGTVQAFYEYKDTDGSGRAYLILTVTAVTRVSGARIEGVGVVPDVLLVPMTPDGRAPMTRSSLDASPPLNSFATDRGPLGPTPERRVVELQYRWQMPRARSDPVEQVLEDFEVRLARDLLLHASGTRRSEIVPELEKLVQETPLPEPVPPSDSTPKSASGVVGTRAHPGD
jgi:hypothetical protein